MHHTRLSPTERTTLIARPVAAATRETDPLRRRRRFARAEWREGTCRWHFE